MEIKGIIKYILVVLAIVIVGFLLQTTVFPHMELAGVTPNIMVIIITSYGLMRGRKQGMIIGFCISLAVRLLDYMRSSIFIWDFCVVCSKSSSLVMISNYRLP